MSLLTVGNPKLMKGTKKGYLSFVLHLAPASLSGYNVCPMASDGCRSACLNTAGRGGIFKLGATTNAIQQARIRKTRMFFENRPAFMAALVKDIRKGIAQAERKGLTPVFRLNGTSDIRWENIPVSVPNSEYTFRNVMEMFPGVTFYDYTKILNRRDLPANYHLTVSRSETNEQFLSDMGQPYNIAVVFNGGLPAEYLGRTVVNGDDTDLRFLDPAGVVVGLKAKGKAKKDTSGFVVSV
jgi:hypothetical protein